MDNNKQRLIPIKKADGTIERVTFDEFKKRQKEKKQETVNVSDKKPTEGLKKIKPAPLVNVMQKDDNRQKEKSLLEEPLEGVKQGNVPLSNNRMDEVEKIIKKVRFVIREPERLKKVIQARLKDVRSVSETKEKMVAPIEKGGVGLTEKEALEVLSLCDGGLSVNKKEDILLSEKKQEVKQKSPLDIFVEQRSMSGSMDDISSLVKKPPQQASSVVDKSLRPMVNDVLPIKKSGFGPVDEIQSYNLTDFRRLSAKPEEASDRFKQKFIILRDESYLFYIKALIAWRQSPLYSMMMNKVSESLNSGKKLADVLTSDGIKLGEIEALLNMEKELD